MLAGQQITVGTIKRRWTITSTVGHNCSTVETSTCLIAKRTREKIVAEASGLSSTEVSDAIIPTVELFTGVTQEWSNTLAESMGDKLSII